MKYILFLLITSFGIAQQTRNVDFKSAHAELSFSVPQKMVMGKVKYTFEVLDKKTDTIYIDARNMAFSEVKINGKKVKWASSAKNLKLFKGYK
ncbi:MAG: M1 family peptidase, partial [Flavobacterium sp.]